MKLKEKAFLYLKKKIRSKGNENQHDNLCMSDYLLPENRLLTIAEKQRLFGVKNRMTNIPSNFATKNTEYKCYCGKKEDMKHIYYCDILSEEKDKRFNLKENYNGTVIEQIEVFRIFENNMKKRENLKMKFLFQVVL